jgi:hypothetical protein
LTNGSGYVHVQEEGGRVGYIECAKYGSHVYDINHLLLPLEEAWKVTKSNVHDHLSISEGVEEPPPWVDNGF